VDEACSDVKESADVLVFFIPQLVEMLVREVGLKLVLHLVGAVSANKRTIDASHG